MSAQRRDTPPVCASAAIGFAALTFPDDARLAILLDWRDPTLDAAASSLEAWARTHRDLPLVDLLPLRNLAFEVRILGDALARVGATPSQILKLVTPKGDSVWLLPPACDLPMWEATWAASAIDFRPQLRGRVGTPPAASSFPFDVVLLLDGHVVLGARTQGTHALRWFTDASLVPRPDATSLASWLTKTAFAPVRVAFRGTGLLAENGGSVSEPTLRASQNGVDLGVGL